MRRAAVILIILAVVISGGWVGYQRFGGAKAPDTPDYEVGQVTRGNIAATVSATGSVQPEKEARLTFQSAGTITSVAVTAGDRVSGGQMLAELDTTDLDLAIRQAQISLRTAQAQLQQLQDGPSASDVAAAQAVLSSAQVAYQQLLKGVDADQLTAEAGQVEQAKVQLQHAQEAYDKVKDQPNVGMFPQSIQLQQATVTYETAQAQYRVATRGADQAQLSAAQAQIAQAQATIDKLQRGPSPSQLEIARAGVEQTQLAVEQAQRRLDNARITTPWDGTVTAVNIVVGSLAQPGTPAIQITDVSRFHIDLLVDEVDIASVAVRQPVTLELDALPDQELTGHVSMISPASTPGTGGVVSYQVRVTIDPSDAPLRAGMSATAIITSSSHENVLLIPNRSVQIERETGKTYVERLANGLTQRVELRLGLRDDTQSEVQAGLVEGDQVVIRNFSSIQQLQQSFGGPAQ